VIDLLVWFSQGYGLLRELAYLVGMAEQSSAIDMAMHWMKIMAMIQPQTIPAVPAYPMPSFIECQ
jgi:hypothetical protein